MATSTRTSLDDLKPTVSKYAEQFNVPEELIWGVIRAENSGSPGGASRLKDVSTEAISPKNARGVMQVTPVALQDVKNAGLVPSTLEHDKLSVEDQIGVGTAYLSRLLKLSQKPDEVYAMYNYGPKARFRMDQLPEETRGYLEKTGSSQSSSQVTKTGGGGTGTFGGGSLDGSNLIQMLLNNGQQQNRIMAEGQQEISGINSAAQQKAQQSIQEQTAVVTSAAVNAARKAEVDFKANKTLESLQSMFGLNQQQADNEIATSLATINASQQAYKGARAEYDQLAGADLLSNPIEWILAQVKMPAAAAKVNAIADAEDRAVLNIDTRTRQLAQAKSTITTNTADQLREIQLSDAKNQEALARAKLTDAESKNLVQSATAKLQNIAISNQMGDNMRSTLVAVTNLEDRAESKEIRDEQKRQIMAGRKLKDDEEIRLNARLKIVSDSKGMAEPMTMKRLTTLTDKKSQEEWLAAAQSGGFGEKLDDSLRFYLGQGSSKVAIQNAGGASIWNTAEKLARTGAEYAGIADKAHTRANPTGKKLTNEEARAQGYELYKNEIVDSAMKPTEAIDLSSSKWDKTYNPYKAEFKGFNSAIDQMPQLSGLKNNSVKLAVDTLIQAGAVRNDNLSSDQQQQVFKSVVERVKVRELEPKKAAADIAAYIRGSAAYNRTLNKYDLFSLPNQQSYLFTLDGSWPTNSRDKVDLMNPVDVENKILKTMKFGQPVTLFTDTGD